MQRVTECKKLSEKKKIENSIKAGVLAGKPPVLTWYQYSIYLFFVLSEYCKHKAYQNVRGTF